MASRLGIQDPCVWKPIGLSHGMRERSGKAVTRGRGLFRVDSLEELGGLFEGGIQPQSLLE